MFEGTTSSATAKEAYKPIREYYDVGRLELGHNTSAILASDPKLLLFTLSKYKFAGKLLAGKDVLEIGCMDGTGSLLLSSMVRHLTAVDFYKPHIEDCIGIQSQGFMNNVSFHAMDILDEVQDFKLRFNGVVCFDVLEHLDPAQEMIFCERVHQYCSEDATFICGIPSLESQRYTSEVNRRSHINCMEFERFISIFRDKFKHVMPFSMNDEVLHTGFWPMSQYNIIACTTKI